MYIITVPHPTFFGSVSDTVQVQVQLPKEGLVVDERIIPFDFECATDEYFEFHCVIEGTTLTVTAIAEHYQYWNELVFDIYFRAYDPEIEEVPDFTDESYMYHGLENETPPRNVKEVIIHPSATVIREDAFYFCKMMERCIMGDNVKRIEEGAFLECYSLRSIRLSRTLQYIGEGAFHRCDIQCLFIPPSVEEIQDGAFSESDDLKILVLPDSIDLEQVGHDIVCECPEVLDKCVEYYKRINPDIDIDNYYYNENENDEEARQINHWLKHRYDHLPLIRLCADPDISAPMIRDFIQTNGTAAFFHTDADDGLTPLHILTGYNAFARTDVIVTCYEANPSALVTPDREGNTPLTNLWEKEDKYANDDVLDLIVQLVQDFVCSQEAKPEPEPEEANFKSTNDGKKKREDDENAAPVS